jgi:hypothetical protein
LCNQGINVLRGVSELKPKHDRGATEHGNLARYSTLAKEFTQAGKPLFQFQLIHAIRLFDP